MASIRRGPLGDCVAVGAPETVAPQLAILAEGALTTAAIAGSAESARQARAAAEILINAALAPAASSLIALQKDGHSYCTGCEG